MQKIRITVFKIAGSLTIHGISEFSAYCVCAVRGKKNERFKTPIDRAASPSWNHIQELTVDSNDTLQFSIYNEVSDGDELLARAVLEASAFLPEGLEKRLELTSHGKLLPAKLAIKIIVDGARSPRQDGPRSPRHDGRMDKNRADTPNSSARSPRHGKIGDDRADTLNSSNPSQTDARRRVGAGNAGAFPESPDDGLAMEGIRVLVVGAEGLRKADLTDGSDPYCVCTVQGKKGMRFKTPVVQDTQSPKWSFEHEFKPFGVVDALQFSVFDKDIAGDDLLGRAILKGADIFPNGFSGKLPLQSKGSTSGMLDIAVEKLESKMGTSRGSGSAKQESSSQSQRGRPSTLVSEARVVSEERRADQNSLVLGQASTSGSRAREKKQNAGSGGGGDFIRVRCTIIGARELRKLDFANRAVDAFCSCDILGKDDMHFETPVVVNKFSPTWNYALMFLEFDPHDSLEFCVWDRGVAGDDLLGRALVPPSDFIPAGFRGEIFLRDGGRNSQATLSLKLEILNSSVVAGRMEATPHAALQDWNEDTSSTGLRVWEWTPSPCAFELEYEVGWEIAIEEERRCGREVALILSRSRTDIYELRQRISEGQAEVAKLQQQLTMSEQPWQCRSCDRQQLNVQTLSRALNRACRAIFIDYISFNGTSGSWRRGPVVAHELLQEVTEALAGAAHIKPDIAELAGYLAHELAQRASLPDVQQMGL